MGMNGARTSRIRHDGAAQERKRPTLATGGHAFVFLERYEGTQGLYYWKQQNQ